MPHDKVVIAHIVGEEAQLRKNCLLGNGPAKLKGTARKSMKVKNGGQILKPRRRMNRRKSIAPCSLYSWNSKPEIRNPLRTKKDPRLPSLFSPKNSNKEHGVRSPLRSRVPEGRQGIGCEKSSCPRLYGFETKAVQIHSADLLPSIRSNEQRQNRYRS